MGGAAAAEGADGPGVVDRDSDPRLLDDCRRQPRQDARRVAGGGVAWIRSASGSRTCAASPVPSPLETFVHVLAQLHLRPCLSVVPSRVLRHVGRKLRKARELGSYQLVELLGHGGMGEVWRAKHRLLARDAGGQAGPARGARRRSEAEARLVHAPLRARGAGHRRAQLAAHDRAVRLRRAPTTARSTT